MFIAASLMLKLFGGMYLFASYSCRRGFVVGVIRHVNLWNVLLTATDASMMLSQIFSCSLSSK